MQKFYICPDREKITIKDCLNKCRMEKRCSPLAFLRTIAKSEREWKGVPSVTQLIKGTREAYLMLKRDYAVNLQNEIFALMGTGLHKVLEGQAVEPEVTLTLDGISGTADELENKVLKDYKTVGSYKVALATGMTVINTEEVPTGEFYKNGKEKTKKYKTYAPVLENVDCRDWELQLNEYRMMKESVGKEVDFLEIFACVRDGGTYLAKGRGIETNFYVIPIKKLPDDEVSEYFARKKDRLLECLAEGVVPEVCNAEENWNGNKCEKYCYVNEFCER